MVEAARRDGTMCSLARCAHSVKVRTGVPVALYGSQRYLQRRTELRDEPALRSSPNATAPGGPTGAPSAVTPPARSTRSPCDEKLEASKEASAGTLSGVPSVEYVGVRRALGGGNELGKLSRRLDNDDAMDAVLSLRRRVVRSGSSCRTGGVGGDRTARRLSHSGVLRFSRGTSRRALRVRLSPEGATHGEASS
jgi:hypothetical protein